MDAVVVQREADEQRVLAELLLEMADDRDRAAAADGHGRAAPFLGQRGRGPGELRAVMIDRHRAVALAAEEFHRAVRRDAGAHEGTHRVAHMRRVLVGDEAAGDLGGGDGGDDGLAALANIAAPHAVDLEGRARAGEIHDGAALLARGDGKADRAEELLRRQAQPLPLRLHVGRRLAHVVIEAGNGDAAGLVMHLADDLRQHMQGLRAAPP